MITKGYFASFLLSLFILFSPVVSVAQDTTKGQERAVRPTIPDTLLFKIQKAQSVITEIKSASKRGYGITRIRAELTIVKNNVTPIQTDIEVHKKTIDPKNLTTYNLILNDALEKLGNWRTSLSKSSNDLQSQLDQVLALSTDSLLTVAGNDTTQKKLYIDQLRNLRIQLQEAGNQTTARLDTVSRLLADVSGMYLTINTLQTSINDVLQKSTENIFRRQSPYLWQAPGTLGISNWQTIIQSTYQGQDQILNYFFASTWDNRLLLLLVTGAFFAWVFFNFRKAHTLVFRKKIAPQHFHNIRPIPIVSTLIVLFNLTPLFEPQSTSLYIEITQFVLFLILTVHLWKRLSQRELRLWIGGGVLYVLLLASSPLVGDSVFLRLWLILLNLCFLYIGFIYAKRLPHKPVADRLIRPISRLFLILQLLAIVLNIFGRISLAKTFTTTAVIGLVQITGLGIFIEIMLEALELQINISAYAKGLFSRINVNHTRRSLRKGLTFLAVIIWLLVFFINMGIADNVFGFIYQILTRPRNFGSISFTLSNLLSFGIIIYLSSLLQKNIGLFFGESQLPAVDGQSEQVSSVLALIRLAIIVAGVLLAVAASGISVDKFTVVLGALSVGIGLGMQTIISNFVSGIILIFERPFRIGDYIELADKKGRIRDIGIRSSKMITVQGSEVIIPNGDLLSNRLVNWTSSDTYLKSELTLKVSMDTDLQAMKDIVKTEASQLDGAIKTMSPEILVTAIGADSVELKVLVWLQNIYSEASLKSQLLQRLAVRFKEANIKLV